MLNYLQNDICNRNKKDLDKLLQQRLRCLLWQWQETTKNYLPSTDHLTVKPLLSLTLKTISSTLLDHHGKTIILRD